MAITDLIPWKKEKTDVSVHPRSDDDKLLDLRSQMNQMFDEFFERPFGLSPFFGETSFSGDFTPRLDISETDKEVTLAVELPGLDPEDIDIALDRNVLIISGEKRSESEKKGERFYRVERSYGAFHRSISLPAEVDENKIDASFKRGVLKIRLPKTAKGVEKSKRIPVKTG